jgi:hypothetical protein
MNIKVIINKIRNVGKENSGGLVEIFIKESIRMMKGKDMER